MPDTMKVHTGTEITVEHIDSLADGGARFDITAEDGRTWRIDLYRDGSTEVVTTRQDGTLADLDVPEWLEDVTARLSRL
jgi:hypothetical protein